MRKQPILRPRQLFPEVAAPWIHLQRGLLRVVWWFREEDDWSPAWSLGALSGVLGIMLAILLFFLDESNHSVVATTTTIQPNQLVSSESTPQKAVQSLVVPEVEEFPLEDSSLVLPAWQDLTLEKSDLTQSSLTRTRFLVDWEMTGELVSRSVPTHLPDQMVPDRWGKYASDPSEELAFRSYAEIGINLPVQANLLSPSNSVGPFTSVDSGVLAGIEIEKILPPRSSQGDPTTYEIHVRNTTDNSIEYVEIRERVTAIRRVSNVQPPARVEGDELIWSLGRFAALDEKLLTITLVPEGPLAIDTKTTVSNTSRIGTIALVAPPAVDEPKVPSVVERELPTLTEAPEPESIPEETPEDVLPEFPEANHLFPATVDMDPPIEPEFAQDEVMPPAKPNPEPIVVEEPEPFVQLTLAVGEIPTLYRGKNLTVAFTVTNVGTAMAENVTLFVELPEQFKHRYGNYVRHRIDRLAPSESRRAILRAETLRSGSGPLDATVEYQGAKQDSEVLFLSVDESTAFVNESEKEDARKSSECPPEQISTTEEARQATQDDGWTPTAIR